MSTAHAPVPPTVHLPDRLLTVADLAALPQELPTGPVDYELDNGRLVIMSPAGHRHGSIQSRIATQLTVHGEWPGHGLVYTEVGVVLRRDPDRLVSPDVAFVSNARLPVRETSEGYLETAPDVVVEVRSKNDSDTELAEKTTEYLRAGVQVVLIVNPDSRTVVMHTTDSAPRTFRHSESIPLAAWIAGFDLSLATIFGD